MLCQEDGHTHEACPNQKCRTCGILGHGTRDCPKLTSSRNSNQADFVRKNKVLQRIIRPNEEDELFDQALFTKNTVDKQQTNNSQASLHEPQNYQKYPTFVSNRVRSPQERDSKDHLQSLLSNPVPSTSRQSYSSIYTPPEFEPVKKKARNFDHEENLLQSGKNHDYLDYMDRNKDSINQSRNNENYEISASIPLKIQSRRESDQTKTNIENWNSEIPALPQLSLPSISKNLGSSDSRNDSRKPSENPRFDPSERTHRISESGIISNDNSPSYSPVGPSALEEIGDNIPQDDSPVYVPVNYDDLPVIKTERFPSKSPPPIRYEKLWNFRTFKVQKSFINCFVYNFSTLRISNIYKIVHSAETVAVFDSVKIAT